MTRRMTTASREAVSMTFLPLESCYQDLWVPPAADHMIPMCSDGHRAEKASRTWVLSGGLRDRAVPGRRSGLGKLRSSGRRRRYARNTGARAPNTPLSGRKGSCVGHGGSPHPSLGAREFTLLYNAALVLKCGAASGKDLQCGLFGGVVDWHGEVCVSSFQKNAVSAQERGAGKN
jgi:hypothetical protein